MTEQTAQHATIQGHVTYREGDGVDMKIPEGPVELFPTKDSVTLTWNTSDGSAGQAAMPHAQYQQYVDEGKIVHAGGRQGQRGEG